MSNAVGYWIAWNGVPYSSKLKFTFHSNLAQCEEAEERTKSHNAQPTWNEHAGCSSMTLSSKKPKENDV